MAVLFLGGCGDLPRPFAHTPTGPVNQLTLLRDGAGLKVEPVAGLPSLVSANLADEIARVFRRANIVATTDPAFTGQYVLRGNRVSMEQMVDGRLRSHIVWRLVDDRGAVAGRLEQAVFGDKDGWATADPALMSVVAEEAVPGIARLLQDSDREIASAVIVRPSVLLGAIRGAPGDGALSLRRALIHHLRRSGVDVVEAGHEGKFSVEGRIDLSPPVEGRQQMKIVWLVRDAGGRELGKVRQANSVPVGKLDRRWGDIAFAIAAGASDGIIDVLRRTDVSAR